MLDSQVVQPLPKLHQLFHLRQQHLEDAGEHCFQTITEHLTARRGGMIREAERESGVKAREAVEGREGMKR